MENSNRKYNFVILGPQWDLYKISFKDVVKQNDVCYIDDDISYRGSLYRFFHRLHFSMKMNSIFLLPFKKLWLYSKINPSFKNKKDICFIIFSTWVNESPETKVVPFLRKRYPNCKIVWFVQDILKTIRNPYTKKNIDVYEMKKKCDLVVSYDMNDAKKYDLAYHPTVLSPIPVLVEKKYQSDIFFIGKSKKRLDLLIEISKRFRDYGIKCNFMIYGIPAENRRCSDYINYINVPLSYSESLIYAQNAKCLLELMQPDAVGYTFRTSEAVLYGKKLITNNPYIKSAPFYNDKDIVFFSEPTESFFEETSRKIQEGSLAQYKNFACLAPAHLLNFIEVKLN